MSKSYAHSLIPGLRKLGIPFILRVRIAKAMANNKETLTSWLHGNFPDGSVKNNCMDPQCSCDLTVFHEGTIKVRKHRKINGEKVVKVKEKRVRITYRESKGGIQKFEYI